MSCDFLKEGLRNSLSFMEPERVIIFRRPDGSPVEVQEVLSMLEKDDPDLNSLLDTIHSTALSLIRCQQRTAPGYHLKHINKGSLGEISKIREEVEELADAAYQNCKVMELVELSDLVGAIKAYLEKHHSETKFSDLEKMADITKRAFENGHR